VFTSFKYQSTFGEATDKSIVVCFLTQTVV